MQYLTLSVHTSLNNCAIEMIQRGKLIFSVLAMHYEPLNHANCAIIDLFMAVRYNVYWGLVHQLWHVAEHQGGTYLPQLIQFRLES